MTLSLYNTNPVSRGRPGCSGSLRILTNWSLVSHYRSWSSSDERGVTGKWEKIQYHQIRTLSSSFSSNVRNEVTYFSEGRRGKTFHWSSSLSKWRRFMILFFSSGGMKFSMIRFLVKNTKGQMTKPKPSHHVQEFCLFIAYFRIKPWGHVGLTWISSLLSARSLSAPVPASLWHVHWWYLQSQTSPAAAYCKTEMNNQCGVDYCKNKTKI